jgi:hypothetical protein
VSNGELPVVYTLLAVVSAAGLLASLGCHVLGWLEVDPPGGEAVFLLHVGIFVVWVPLVLCANRAVPKGGASHEHLRTEAAGCAAGFVGVLFVYAIVNFLIFMAAASPFPKGRVPFLLQLRGFSGHWMLFYGVASVGFAALARRARKPPRGPRA